VPDRFVSLNPLRYRADDTHLSGYLARDEKQVAPQPGIVIVHDAWGVGENVKMRAHMLAELGFVALVADLYGEGNAPRIVDEARAKVEYFKSNLDVLRGRIIAALEALRAQRGVDRARLGAIGYCFGGTTVLELARAGAECAAVVSFHGLLTTSKPAAAGSIRSKLLVCTGAEDPMAPFEDVAAFQQEMRAAEADCQIIIYSGAQHGFANPFSSKLPGISHNVDADRRSWAAMRAHFAEAFG
jgi:dienelactone hydrolase